MTQEIANKIETFFHKYPIRTYSKGHIIIMSGEKTDTIYQIVDGSVKQYDVTTHGDEIVLNIFKPPAFFPLSSAINKTANHFIYEADSDVKLRQAPAKEVISFIKDNSDVMFDLLSRVFRGTDGLLGRMAHLMGSGAHNRLVYELLLEGRRFGTAKGDGCYALKISEKDLAARAGLSRETVSRELGILKREKLVTVKPREILISNMVLLEKKLNP